MNPARSATRSLRSVRTPLSCVTATSSATTGMSAPSRASPTRRCGSAPLSPPASLALRLPVLREDERCMCQECSTSPGPCSRCRARAGGQVSAPLSKWICNRARPTITFSPDVIGPIGRRHRRCETCQRPVRRHRTAWRGSRVGGSLTSILLAVALACLALLDRIRDPMPRLMRLKPSPRTRLPSSLSAVTNTGPTVVLPSWSQWHSVTAGPAER